MHRGIARGLASVLLVVSLGAAQGPNSSGSQDSRITKSIPSASEAGIAQSTQAQPKHPKPYQIGTASWYGDDFEGKTTASGEPFNMYDLTAAHPTLPLGSWVKVTNLRNGRAVVVRVNDRGPVVPGRIIDVSYSAAEVCNWSAWIGSHLPRNSRSNWRF